MNPTRILTVPGFGGTATLKYPTLPLTLRIPPRLRGGGCQIFHLCISRWQYNHCFYAKPHSVQLEHPVTRSASETEIKLPTTGMENSYW